MVALLLAAVGLQSKARIMLSQHARAVTHRAPLTAVTGWRYVGWPCGRASQRTAALWVTLWATLWPATGQLRGFELGRPCGRRKGALSPSARVTLVHKGAGPSTHPTHAHGSGRASHRQSQGKSRPKLGPKVAGNARKTAFSS